MRPIDIVAQNTQKPNVIQISYAMDYGLFYVGYIERSCNEIAENFRKTEKKPGLFLICTAMELVQIIAKVARPAELSLQ